MRKLQNRIDQLTTGISACLFAALTVILSYNVFTRFLGGGISWYMEASQYMNVWAMMIAGIGITSKGEHLRISAVESLTRGKGKKILQVIITILTVAFYVLLAYGTYLLAIKSKQNISTMGSLKMSYVYWPLPVISALSAISALLHGMIQQTEPREEGESKP